MIYHLIDYLSKIFDIPGSGMFEYISFRAGMAVILALVIALIFGTRIIRKLQTLQIGEEIRNLGLAGQMEKRGTPTMGGIIILLSILVPVLLFAKLDNPYTLLMIASTVWLGAIGFLDDYIKVFRKNKEGLKGKFKVVAQVGLGIIVGCTMWASRDMTVVRHTPARVVQVYNETPGYMDDNVNMQDHRTTKVVRGSVPVKTPITTIPFVKNHEFNYSKLIPVGGEAGDIVGWLVYVIVAIFVITAVSNGANLTDGLDGLAAGTTAIIGVALMIFAYLSGNIIYSQYLNIMYIPNSGELVVFGAAFVGALIGFLWYNSYPAQVFMGDTGSLSIGGIVAVFALLIHKELLLPILCGIYLVESLSVMMQVSYFKYTKKKYGEGRRIFLMSPLHHHYQKKGYPEMKIVVRFWIVQLLLAAITIITLKIR